MANPLDLVAFAKRAWEQAQSEYGKTSQPLKERATILPFGQYEDGSVGLAWPGILAAPAEGMVNFGRYGYDSPEAIRDNALSAFDVAGGAVTGGLGVGLAGGLVDNAVGSAGGNLARGASELPMDLASRMARAREMGFDTERTLYHGTDARFDEFDIGRAGEASGSGGFLGAGAYFADNPLMAGNYGQNVGDYFIRPGRQLDMTQPYSTIARELPDLRMKDGTPWLEAFSRRDAIEQSIEDVLARPDGRGFVDLQYKVNGEWVPVQRRVSELEISEDGGRSAALAHALNAAGLSDPENIGALGNYFGAQTVTDAARKAGFDSAKAPGSNLWDGGNEYVSFDPRNIRSVNAAFDPSKSNSANLLAANAKTGAAVPLLQNALERAQPQGIRAYHGSPHDFDRFSLDKIGTGEGAQAYGHGLYFADSEDVARSYRDALKHNVINLDGLPTSRELAADELSNRIRDAIPGVTQPYNSAKMIVGWMAEGASPQDVIKRIDAGAWPGDLKAELKLAAEAIQNSVSGNTGRMYEVNIRANPEDFLDWDKPLSQQSEAIRSAVTRLANGEILPDWSGMQAYRSVGSQMMSELDLESPDISKALRDAGIPGIRYLDGMSRGTGEGTSNYVVFDDQLIDILRKYANAPTGAAVPLVQETQDQDNPLMQYLRMIGL